MAESEFKAWWEREKNPGKVILKIKKHPHTSARQIGVALDMASAPPGSDQETFPTLDPAEAEKLLNKK